MSKSGTQVTIAPKEKETEVITLKKEVVTEESPEKPATSSEITIEKKEKPKKPKKKIVTEIEEKVKPEEEREISLSSMAPEVEIKEKAKVQVEVSSKGITEKPKEPEVQPEQVM